MRSATEHDVLLVVDVQNDFCPGGALVVPGGNEIVPAVNRLARDFAHVVLTQDWHPAGHSSFASAHPGKSPFETMQMPYGPQILWPDHCVQATPGAALHPALDVSNAELIVRKGFHPAIDSYSAFQENDRKTLTGLASYLRRARLQAGDRGRASPPISACSIRRSTRAPPGLPRPSSWTPAAVSISTARSPARSMRCARREWSWASYCGVRRRGIGRSGRRST